MRIKKDQGIPQEKPMELLWIGIGVLVGVVIFGFVIVWLIQKMLRMSGRAYRDTIDKM